MILAKYAGRSVGESFVLETKCKRGRFAAVKHFSNKFDRHRKKLENKLSSSYQTLILFCVSSKKLHRSETLPKDVTFSE